MVELKENRGIPRHVLLMMAIIAGFTVANCYYNQPLLELIRQDLGINEQRANLITVITQIGYALGLLFLIPMGDLYSRRRIIIINMSLAAIASVAIAFAQNIQLVWGASLVLGSCSVIPQYFIPIASQFSIPKNKNRNMGFVLSGLLTGILASRMVSGYIGDWLGWREMFMISAFLMIACMLMTLIILPEMKRNFIGSYRGLMVTVVEIFIYHPTIRLYATRAAFGFGSMMAIWSCLAFHLAQPPFNAGSESVGALGACGIAGAIVASGLGKFVTRWGIRNFSLYGALMQMGAWACAIFMGDSYTGLIIAIILVDIGLQCQQLSNQSGCIQEIPEASNRANTVFMTTYFIGGSLGTFFAGLAWGVLGWVGVCIVGIAFALVSLTITVSCKK